MAKGDLIEVITNLENARLIERSSLKSKNDLINQIKKRIARGESTGDSIKDFTFVHYAGNPDCERKLRGLYNSLSSNEGQLVLAELQYKELKFYSREGCFGGGSHYADQTIFQLGKIKKPYLALDETLPKDKTSFYIGPIREIICDPTLTLFGEEVVKNRLINLEKEEKNKVGKNIPLSISHYLSPKEMNSFELLGLMTQKNPFSLRLEAERGFMEQLPEGIDLCKIEAFNIYAGEEVDKFFEKVILMPPIEERNGLSEEQLKAQAIYKKYKKEILE